MSRSASWFLSLLCLTSAAVLMARPALAWVETTVKSDSVTIDLESDGSAIVAHELLLRIRGGPLKELVLAEVDEDAEPLPDATVTRARSGRAAGHPIGLLLDNVDGNLVAKVLYKRGLRGGTFLFRMRYRSSFARSERLHPAATGAELRWQSPRFSNGIDSMRLLLRLPAAETPPRLPSADEDDEPVGIREEFQGVFLGTWRRSGEKDELEIVRPHVAKNEAVVWRALVDPSAFDLDLAPVTSPAPRVERRVSAPPPSSTPLDWRLAVVALGLGVLFALLLWLKTRAVTAACRERGATPRFAIPCPLGVRLLLAMASVAGAVLVFAESEQPTAAGALLALAIGLAVHAAATASPLLRGPGQWEQVSEKEAFDAARGAGELPGRLLDAGTLPGFFVFLLLLCAFVGAFALWLERSAYEAVMIALGSSLLFPIFCTGRVSSMPPDPILGPRRLLRPLYRRLKKERWMRVSPLLRRPAGKAPDEIRVLIEPKRARRGFVAIEAGVDFQTGPGGPLPLPFVIVRVVEASPSFEAMPKGLLWTRGRSADERVAVIRPKLPTSAMWLTLTRRLAKTLTSSDEKTPKRQPAIKLSRSAGKGSSTQKGSTVSSPAHAM